MNTYVLLIHIVISCFTVYFTYITSMHILDRLVDITGKEFRISVVGCLLSVLICFIPFVNISMIFNYYDSKDDVVDRVVRRTLLKLLSSE